MAKILFLSHRAPYPPDKGDRIRAFHIFRHLSAHHQVWLGALGDPHIAADHLSWLESRCVANYIVPRNSIAALSNMALAALRGNALSVGAFADAGLARWCAHILATVAPDIIYVFSSAMAQYVRAGAESPMQIVDFVDVDSEKFRAYAEAARGPMRSVYKLEADRLLRFDRKVALGAEAGLFISETEREQFVRLCPEVRERLHVIPNGVDCAYFDPDLLAMNRSQGRPIIIFTGRMDYRPNIDGVLWFAESIFPAVQRQFPDAIFQIVGAEPARQVRALQRRPGIKVTGRVPDIRPFLRQASVAVAPLRIARGVQNKVLEAMAMAKAVVATPAALDGILAGDGEHVLVAKSEAAFGQAVIKALEREYALELGRRARANVMVRHGWPQQITLLDSLIEQISAQPQPSIRA